MFVCKNVVDVISDISEGGTLFSLRHLAQHIPSLVTIMLLHETLHSYVSTFINVTIIDVHVLNGFELFSEFLLKFHHQNKCLKCWTLQIGNINCMPLVNTF